LWAPASGCLLSLSNQLHPPSAETSLDQLMPLLYAELRKLARGYLQSERPNHTLQPTALVHEAYLRLMGQHNVDWQNRAQVLGIAAQMMRRILYAHAERRNAGKREGRLAQICLTEIPEPALASNGAIVAFLDLDRALKGLSELDERQGRVAELRLLGGLTSRETAEVLDVSIPTVDRDWASARLWLMRELRQGSAS